MCKDQLRPEEAAAGGLRRTAEDRHTGQDGGAQQEVTEPTKVHIKAPALLTQSGASLKEDEGLISLEEDL